MRVGSDPGWGVPAALCVLSLSAVAFEVCLLRAFAFVFRYHFLFLIVSLAICGYGIGALARYLFFRRPAGDDGRAARFAVLFAVSLPLTLLLVLHVGVARVSASPLPVLLLPVLPFLLVGLCFAELFARYGAEAARLYGWDLAGAASASVAAIGLLAWIGAINGPLLLGVVAGGAALLLAARLGWPDRLIAGGAVLAGAVLLGSNVAFGWIDIPRLSPDADPTLTKPLLRELGMPNSPSRIVETRWSAFARVDLVAERDVPDVRYVYTDGDTPTHMLEFDGDLAKVRFLAGWITYLPFEVARPKSVLAIGPGGGMDVLMARLAGATRVDGVEISDATVDLVHDYRAFSGDPYRLPGVRIYVMDGRSFVTGSRDSYDLIYSALTLTATSGRAAMAHTESYIHTVDAFHDYWRRLTPNGVFGLVLQEELLTFRAFMTALEVLRREGKPAPEAMQHLALVQVPEQSMGFGPYRRLVLMKRSPFTPEEARRLMRGIELRRLHAVYVPHELTSILPYRDLLSGARRPEEVLADAAQADPPLDLAPVTDDRPFFVWLFRQLPPYFMPLMLWLVVFTAGFALVPLLPWRWRIRLAAAPAVMEDDGEPSTHDARPAAQDTVSSRAALLPFALLFALLGAGFMLLEIPLIQQFILFLGHPTLSLAVVLFSLLLGTATGSSITQRWGYAQLRGRVAVAALLVAGFSLGLYAAVPGAQRALAGTPVWARVVATGLPVFVLGIGLGMPFPTGLRLVCLRDTSYIPWAWGINGLMSVFGSVLAMSLALRWGFHAAFSGGAAAYLLASALIAVLPRAGVERGEVRATDSAAPHPPTPSASLRRFMGLHRQARARGGRETARSKRNEEGF